MTNPIPLNQKFIYPHLEQVTQESGYRHYVTPDGFHVPSVTTIIGEMTDKSFLDNWRERIGDDKADDIVRISSQIGSHMHNNIEAWLNGQEPVSGSNMIRKQSRKLANIIIDKALKPNLSEFYGAEVHQYYKDLYAGTSDLIGIYNGEESIIDFKNSRKPKTDERIHGYKMQVAAYGMAHNHNYGTNIRQGVILMCSREQPYFGEFQEWVIKGDEWEQACHDWINILSKFHA